MQVDGVKESKQQQEEYDIRVYCILISMTVFKEAQLVFAWRKGSSTLRI